MRLKLTGQKSYVNIKQDSNPIISDFRPGATHWPVLRIGRNSSPFVLANARSWLNDRVASDKGGAMLSKSETLRCLLRLDDSAVVSLRFAVEVAKRAASERSAGASAASILPQNSDAVLAPEDDFPPVALGEIARK